MHHPKSPARRCYPACLSLRYVGCDGALGWCDSDRNLSRPDWIDGRYFAVPLGWRQVRHDRLSAGSGCARSRFRTRLRGRWGR